MTAPVLTKAHERILEDKENICRVANIPVSALDKTAVGVLGTEFEWLKRYPFYKRKGEGLVLTGAHNPSVETKMIHMVAVMVRNHIDARIYTLQGVIEAIEKGAEGIDATVLFIPNLYQRQGLKGIPPWKMQLVYDLLLNRYTHGKLSAVYVENLKAMGAEFGSIFQQHLESHYFLSEG